MGVYVDIFKVVVDRLQAATAAGKLLEDVKDIQVGPIRDREGINAYPVLQIFTGSPFVVESFESAARDRKVATINLVIRIIDIATDSRSSNMYFKESDSTGVIFLVEKVLDVLSSKQDGTLDPRLLEFGKRSSILTVGVLEILSDEAVMCNITLEAQLNDFEINNRRQ